MTYQGQQPAVRLPGGVMLLPTELGVTVPGGSGAAGAGAGTANQGYYLPFTAPYNTNLVSMSFYCATGTNNHDLALLDAAGNRLVSRGSTATTAGAVNTWTLTTPWPVKAGVLYWAAFSTAGTKTVARFVGSSVRNPTLGGRAIQAIGAVAIPNPVTFAAPAADNFIPILKLVFSN